ncbi:DENN domain-containing protein 1B-like [Callospermophilus lateralis]|uniref:DENN domain-containing protein 1B-like n=1 Tax=Callospermophilus lateralis TaxID=76772 RepID=UPI0040389A70
MAILIILILRIQEHDHSYFIAPDVTGLPTIPESRNLTEYFVAVDVNNMLQLYASMLHERRIIITSSKLSTLTACLHGLAALLYPMYWQYIYIPVLPPHLLDYCCAPMPYLIGIHSSLIERVKNKSLEDVVMLNVDTNSLESPFNDLNNLPSDVVSALKNKLKKQSTATGDGLARTFLMAQAALFGSYRDALRYKPGEPVTFCQESFVKHRSSVMKQFLEIAVNLQLFKQARPDQDQQAQLAWLDLSLLRVFTSQASLQHSSLRTAFQERENGSHKPLMPDLKLAQYQFLGELLAEWNYKVTSDS